MKKAIIITLITLLFFSCAHSRLLKAYYEFDIRYIAFENENMNNLANLSDDELIDFYYKIDNDLSKLFWDWFREYNLKWGDHVGQNYYSSRWHYTSQNYFKQYLLIRAKNSGKYRIDGDIEWLSFQDKYWIVNVINRIIDANTRNEFQKIGNEFNNDIKLIDNNLNIEQKEWIDNTLKAYFNLGIIIASAPNMLYISQLLNQWTDQLGESVDLRNGIDEWWNNRKIVIEREYENNKQYEPNIFYGK